MNFIEKLSLCWRILRYKHGALVEHAQRELPKENGDMQFSMNTCIREIIFVFGSQRHSGFSASYATNVLEKLLRFEPLSPLTGEDSEWVEVDMGLWQNNRCSRVFKDADGRAYDIEGRVFGDAGGASYTNRNSRVYIDFPYYPKTEYVNVGEA